VKYRSQAESVLRLASCPNTLFHDIISSFERLTGLTACILLKGSAEHDTPYKESSFLKRIGHRNSFCNLIKCAPRKKGCDGYDHIVRMKRAELQGRPFLDECPSGVIELILPLYVHERFIGAIYCGQVAKYKNKQRGFKEIYEKTRRRGCSESKIHEAYGNFVYYAPRDLIKMGSLLQCALLHVAQSLDDIIVERSVRLEQNSIIREAIMILHSSENLPNERQLAGMFRITPEYFSNLFKRVMKKKYIDYITEIRISRAQDLLKFTNLPITDIAAQVGFQGHSYFTSRFRSITGLTPQQFRLSASYFVKVENG
jgi:AraC-like DNA-binding protein